MIDALTPAHVESFHRDGFLIVEEGLVSPNALEMLRERYLRLFEGSYETGIKPDEVNWVEGRDPEDRTRQICNGWRADNVIAAQVLSERTGRLAAQLMGYRGVRLLPGQLPVETAGNQGDRIPSRRLLRRLPGSAGDDHVLDRAARHPRQRRADRVRARIQPLGSVGSDQVAVPRSGGLARGSARRGAGRNRARHRPGRRQGWRRLLPPQPHLARIVTEYRWNHCSHGPGLAHAAGRGTLPPRRTSTWSTPATVGAATCLWTSLSSR